MRLDLNPSLKLGDAAAHLLMGLVTQECSTWNKTAAILMAVNSHADLDALSTQIGVETRES
jgi:hypothetical protein